MGLFGLFGRKKKDGPELDRQQALESVPMVNQLITIDHDAEGHVVLHVPRKRTSMVKMIAKLFRLPPYKQIELDELGTYAVELCDGTRSVDEIVDAFADEFQLNRREAEVSMLTYLQTLAKRGIIGFAVEKEDRNSTD